MTIGDKIKNLTFRNKDRQNLVLPSVSDKGANRLAQYETELPGSPQRSGKLKWLQTSGRKPTDNT